MSKMIELVEEHGEACYEHGRLGAAGEGSYDKACELLAELRTRLEALERIEAASRAYATRYVQDEADDPEVCICPGQHEHAKELIEALSVIEPIRGSWHLDAAMEAANVPER